MQLKNRWMKWTSELPRGWNSHTLMSHKPITSEICSNSTDNIAFYFIDTDYNGESLKGSPTMRTNQQVVDITGAPAQVWGNILIPARGTITLKITGDILQGTVKTTLEKKESWTRIQNIDSIEILEAPIYALLFFGGFLLLSSLSTLAQSPVLGLILLLVDAAIIGWAINNKRRCLAIYSHRNTVAMFVNKPPEIYQQFSKNVLAIARQLNAPVNAPIKQPHSQTR